MKKMNLRKGFTLIELLVVVAIVGILAAVIMASLNSARSKGGDAGAQANLKNATGQGEIFWNANTASSSSYTNVCTNGVVGGVNGIGSFVLAAAKAEGLGSYTTDGTGTGIIAICNDSATAWAAEVPLQGSTTSAIKVWCVDNTGKSKKETVTIGAGTVCS